MKKRIIFPIAVGTLLRIVLLNISIPVNGFYGGDALRYLDIARVIINEGLKVEKFWYPMGYPLWLAFWIRHGYPLWFVSLLQILIVAVFSTWCARKIAKLSTPFWGIVAAWFLAFDPIWMSQAGLIGADSLGACLYGLGFLNLVDALRSFSRSVRPMAVKSGLVLGAATLIKSAYIFTPFWLLPLFWGKKNRSRPQWATGIAAALCLLAAWAAVVVPYSYVRHEKNGSWAVSGHGAGLYKAYIVGSMWVVQGKAPELYSAMEKVTPQTDAVGEIRASPGLFIKLFFVSAFKTVFGHANVNFLYYFSGKEVQGPGLWTQLSNQQGFVDKLKTIPWGWMFGVLSAIVEKAILLIFAALGLLRLIQMGRSEEALAITLTVGYFAFSPVVFGEPRYFLPATIVLLYGAAQANPSFLPRRVNSAN